MRITRSRALACHKLWYLHLGTDAGIRVVAYRDQTLGRMIEEQETGGRFVGVLLRPTVEVRTGDDCCWRAICMARHMKNASMRIQLIFPLKAIEAI